MGRTIIRVTTAVLAVGCAGAAIGASLGRAIQWYALAATGVAALAYAASRVAGSDAEAGADATRPARAGSASTDRPTVASLGSRVEQILKLAEEQSAARIRQAEAEAAAILAGARQEAAEMVGRAGDDAARP